MALIGQKTGNVLDRIIAASDEEKRRNREVIKTLIRSLYFLVNIECHIQQLSMIDFPSGRSW